MKMEVIPVIIGALGTLISELERLILGKTSEHTAVSRRAHC